ncbi:MAG: acetyl-CoA C-acetyltransferase [Legionellales bacterium]|nr:acetyl-CoA C-acetyltransferase [Legionellales bacterium]
MSKHQSRVVYIVDGARTPFLKARNAPGVLSAADLAVHCARQLLARQPFLPADIQEVITGCMVPSQDEANIARIIALRLGCGNKVPAFTVQRNCASGLQALDNAYQDIQLGRHELILAGGVDAMSRAPLIYQQKMVQWFLNMSAAKNFRQRVGQLLKIHPGALFSPIIALIRGLTDPVVGMNMGQTAEELAFQFNITRQEMDEFAAQSHQRVLNAQKNHFFNEIVPLYCQDGSVLEQDDGVRDDSTVEKLGKLKPYFDRKFGQVTAGNSSQITDGAAFLLLASEEAVEKYQLPVMAKIIDIEWAALSPKVMGLGPVYAATALLKRQSLTKDDIDFWEINEAFAAQVLACLKAWEDPQFCQQELGLENPLGSIDRQKLNVDGGAIALGHPVGASGARIVLHLANVLKQRQGKLGLASICIGGGQGGAMLIEAV